MKLVIVESPHKATTIGRYLGPEYQVKASKGHVRDLSSHGSGGLGISIDKDFEPIWEIPEEKKRIVDDLLKSAKKADEVILATDPDREGEAISWHLAQILGLDLKTTKRLQFHEITEPAIKEALANPGHIDLNLVDSQLTRRMYDRIIGFKLSGLLSRKINAKSAGRVQSPTLKMVVDNDKAVAQWVPENYWTVSVALTVEGKEVTASLIGENGKPIEFKSEQEAKDAIAKIPNTLTVLSVNKSKKTSSPKDPFTTSTLQQEASRLYHMPTTKTMEAAQKLYEGVKVGDQTIGLITYMRTDSTRLSDRFYNVHAVPFIKEKFGDDYVGKLKAPKKSAHAQDAHEAIRPTGTHRTPSYVAQFLTKEQANIYRLIYIRALSSVMKPKQSEVTEVTLSDGKNLFLAKGSKTLFPGFEILYKEFEEEEDPKALPSFKEGGEYPISNKEDKKNTKPGPTPYTEGRIVRLMEEEGVGRPSTYASTIKTLLDHNYVTRKSGTIVATEEGTHVTEVMEKFFPEIVSAKYTADMEKTLDDIDNGDVKWLDAMKGFYGPFMEKFSEVSKNMTKDEPELIGENCPDCGAPLVKKKGKKNGKVFIGCSNFPKCKYTRPLPEDLPKETGRFCPECGRPLVTKKNKKGKDFVACSGFPHCTYIEKSQTQRSSAPAKKAYTAEDYVKKCPDCKTGHLIIRKGKKGDFLGCTNFPRCRHTEQLEKKDEGK